MIESEQYEQHGLGESVETLAALRRFARIRPASERCELCGAALDPQHPHLLDTHSLQITCSCDACAILFSGQEGAKFLRVPRRVLRLRNFSFSETEWDAMMLPINLAFFIRGRNGETEVLYPSPAGAMASTLALPAWRKIFAADRTLLALESQVEALLVNRIGPEGAYFVVPLDACYRLVGLIRTSWRGLSGGAEVWQAIAGFFAELEAKADNRSEAASA